MSIPNDDPRLTAYALGEMDAAERAAFEKELTDDARAEIDAIRKMAGAVATELQSETDSGPALTDAQRASIVGKKRPVSPPRLGRVGRGRVDGRIGLPVRDRGTDQRREFGSALRATRGREAGAGRRGRENGHRVRGSLQGSGRTAEAEAECDTRGRTPPAKERARKRILASAKRPLAFNSRPPETEAYDRIEDNKFQRTEDNDVSTFSIDVDTASYANMRRFLREGKLPPKDAVRIEELINYFDYAYAPPAANAKHPFAAHVETAVCPWNRAHRLTRVALKGKAMDERPPTNLVFLLDVSGSMNSRQKLPLLLQSMNLLVDNLGDDDRVAIVVYAGASGLVLESTNEKEQIRDALGRLRAGGSTNGGAGIQLAYGVATRNFIKGGVNRVLLCTDGDFNVGVSDPTAR